MKLLVLKAIKYCYFWSSAKRRQGFSNIHNSVKSYLQKQILSYPYLINYPISNEHVKVMLDDINVEAKYKLHHKMLLQVPVLETHIIDMLKKYLLGFPLHKSKRGLYVLAILLFNYFLHHNYEKCHSVIKLCVVENMHPGWRMPRFSQALAQTRTMVFSSNENYFWVGSMNNWMQKIFHTNIVKLYYLIQNLFIHVLNILHL